MALLPDLSEVLMADATEDWVKALADGVALCLLMKKIRPELVPDIEGTEAPMFLLWANITIFLQALEAMGIREELRFKESDLYYKKNLPAVIHTLLELGCVCAELKLDIPSLPDTFVTVFKEGEDAIAHSPPVNEEQISGADLTDFTFPSVLKRLTTWQGTGKAQKSPRKRLRSSVHRSKEDDKVDNSHEKAAVTIQSFFRMATLRKQLKNRSASHHGTALSLCALTPFSLRYRSLSLSVSLSLSTYLSFFHSPYALSAWFSQPCQPSQASARGLIAWQQVG